MGVVRSGTSEGREEVSEVLGLTYIIAMPGGSSLRKKSLMESQGIKKAKQQKQQKQQK